MTSRSITAVVIITISVIVLSSILVWQFVSDVDDVGPMESIIEISCSDGGSSSSSGTGFAIEYEGDRYIVTNSHVVSAAREGKLEVHRSPALSLMLMEKSIKSFVHAGTVSRHKGEDRAV